MSVDWIIASLAAFMFGLGVLPRSSASRWRIERSARLRYELAWVLSPQSWYIVATVWSIAGRVWVSFLPSSFS